MKNYCKTIWKPKDHVFLYFAEKMAKNPEQ